MAARSLSVRFFHGHAHGRFVFSTVRVRQRRITRESRGKSLLFFFWHQPRPKSAAFVLQKVQYLRG
jgi:hypothetical protein